MKGWRRWLGYNFEVKGDSRQRQQMRTRRGMGVGMGKVALGRCPSPPSISSRWSRMQCRLKPSHYLRVCHSSSSTLLWMGVLDATSSSTS